MMYEPRIRTDDMARERIMPEGNSLRPWEWWIRESPELKQALNGAVRVDPSKPNVWDRQPLLETDCEALTRLGLLTDDDRQFMETEDFGKTEADALSYREYCLGVEKENVEREQQVQTVEPIAKAPEGPPVIPQPIKPTVFHAPVQSRSVVEDEGIMVGRFISRPLKIISGICPRC